MMWFSGAKLPFILWFFAFAAAWFIIMSIQLDEHGFQLVVMKLYATLWNWIDLDPNKRVNVTLRSEEHTSELQSLMRISYAVFCLKKKKHTIQISDNTVLIVSINIIHRTLTIIIHN